MSSNEVINQKADYIHDNPVVEGIVEQAVDYLYSSAKNFELEGGLLEVEKF